MPYESVEQLQQALTSSIFGYAKDAKKAAGRALGTIVEIIAFYLLESWGFHRAVAIERRIPEFGNCEITHNIEYSLHPIFAEFVVRIDHKGQPLTAYNVLKGLAAQGEFGQFNRLSNTLLTKDGILRNACTLACNADSCLVASIIERTDQWSVVSIAQQSIKPYAILECKRVGVEDGAKKGPQTIEKAKQGAYVARSVSSLQKVRLENGELYGVVYQNGVVIHSAPYRELFEFIIKANDPQLLRHFVLTAGIVSNHGNWFTGDDHNKELKVLAQSYDWLIFLTDEGIKQFIEDVILSPSSEYRGIQSAFIASYAPNKTKNQFTKVQINIEAHEQLIRYFIANADRISSWFNVIAPYGGTLTRLKTDIEILKNKPWGEILQ
ncbi:MAG: hypothetical protein OHK0052_20530 [Anaerolineales bacterium]